MSTDHPPSSSSGGEFSAKPPAPVPAHGSGGALTAEELIALNDEIASMARAGLPLDQGLSAVAREMGAGRLQQVTSQLGEDLRAGCTLPEALEKQKGRVPEYYAALLAAGIRSGKIADVLATLTLYARSIADFRGAMVSAILYPVLVMLLGIVLMVFVSYLVIPQYLLVFEAMKLKLPTFTLFLKFITDHPLEILVLPPVVFVAACFVSWFLCQASPSGRMMWARFVNALPVFGTLIRSARLAAFSDLLGILVDQAVPLPEALRLAAQASSDPLLTEGARLIDQDLQQGETLAFALRRQRLVPNLVSWMIGFGEKRGTLGPALHQIAQMYRRHAEVRVQFLSTVLPPLLILLFAATIAGTFIFGLMSPMFALLDGLAGAG